MKIIKNILIAAFPLFLLSSCGNWLDVTPKSQVGLDKMFRNEQGFEDVLIGCYTSMTKKEIYGGEMSYATMDVLAQYYQTDASSHAYNDLAKYNYTGDKAVKAINELWLNAYYTIANCNILLDNLKKADKKLFSKGHNVFIEAEAKAIRAYVHFDILRIFAPAWSGGSDMAIPYADTFKSTPFSQLTAKEVIGRIIQDLEDGRQLLKEIDPVFEDTFKEPIYHFVQPVGKGRSEFLDFRAYRMNYFAITATLARVYHYIGNKQLAYDCAKEIIDNKERFKFTGENEVTTDETTRNVNMKNEILFCLHHETVHKFFSSFGSSTFKVYQKALIYDIQSDFRKNCIKTSDDTSLKYTEFKKDSGMGGKIPLIRITEMFYIAAESIFETNPTLACDYIDEVRINRAISQKLDPNMKYADFRKEVTSEYRKEFLGEGQLFYRYKLLGGNVLRGNAEIVMKKSFYTLPLPSTEVEFGDYKLN